MANPGKSRLLSPILWVSGIVLVVLIGLGIRGFSHDAVEVRVAPVSYQTLSITKSTNGKVEPVEEFQAHAPFAGVIQRILVNVGDHVSKGTLLVQMDDADARARVAAAQAALVAAKLGHQNLQQGGNLEDRNRFASDIASAKLEHDQATSNLAAIQALFAKGSASQAEVTSAQQRLRAADLSLQSAQQRATANQRYSPDELLNSSAHIADMEANLAAAREALNNVNIRSPLPGTVYSIPVSEYDFVPGGDDILDVADLTRIQVRAYFDEPEIGKLARGQSVTIVWDAKPGQVWHGHIERAPTTVITYGTRNVGECIITVDDAKGDLLPNTNVTVTVTERERANVLSVPREALHTDGANNFVYRIVDSKLARTPVQVGDVNLTNVEIVSGLSARDRVVLEATSNGKELTNGLQVKPVE